jgi:hypothetical protein
MRLKKYLNNNQDIEEIDEIFISPDGLKFQQLYEGKWISGKFDKNLRIDRATYGAGQTHAHVLGRKGNEYGVINLDGSASHGSKFQLSKQDAKALSDKGFKIPKNRIVEWIFLAQELELLYS